MPASQVFTTDAGWDFLRETRELLDVRLRDAVHRLGEPIRTVVRYHFGWCDRYGAPAENGSGKAIRPALTLLCAEAMGVTDRGIDAAVAVELAHNFSLLHDDVMDGDRLRRHRPTAWSVFGVPAAVRAGDALLALAVHALTAYPGAAAALSVRRLCDALLDMATGQCQDVSFERTRNVGLRECLTMASTKTAALIGCACALGASLGGIEPSRVDLLTRFGLHLGLTFQLTDDLLGIWGDPLLTGKPAWSDLRSGKKTLPVVAAMTAAGPAARRLAAGYGFGGEPTDGELAETAALIERAGGRRWAEQQADRHLRTALHWLAAADPAPAPADRLAALARLIARRDR